MPDYVGLQLIPLFNQGNDFARWDKSRQRFFGANLKRATHKLRCTRWNPNIPYDPDVKKRLRMARQRPDGWALSVCSIPVRRRKPRKVWMRLPAPLPPPEQRIVYLKSGPLQGKRSILMAMLGEHGLKRKVRKMGNAQCDALYRTILLANKTARRRAARARRRAAKAAASL